MIASGAADGELLVRTLHENDGKTKIIFKDK
jgi:hypothetical protein